MPTPSWDRGAECPVPPFFNRRLYFMHQRIVGEGRGAVQQAGVHRRVKEVVFKANGALSLVAGRTRSGPVAKLEIGLAAHRGFRAGPAARCAALRSSKSEG